MTTTAPVRQSDYHYKHRSIKQMVTLQTALDRIDSAEIYYNNMSHSFKDYPQNIYYITSRIKGLAEQYENNAEIIGRVRALYLKLADHTE